MIFDLSPDRLNEIRDIADQATKKLEAGTLTHADIYGLTGHINLVTTAMFKLRGDHHDAVNEAAALRGFAGVVRTIAKHGDMSEPTRQELAAAIQELDDDSDD